MRLLLDTNVLLWMLQGNKRLAGEARAAIEDTANEVLFSAASIWEIAIKASLARADFGVRPAAIAEAARSIGFQELPVSSTVAATVASLPLLHRDPFDRLLIAQAIAEPARFLTSDGALHRYSELVTVVD